MNVRAANRGLQPITSSLVHYFPAAYSFFYHSLLLAVSFLSLAMESGHLDVGLCRLKSWLNKPHHKAMLLLADRLLPEVAVVS